MKPLKVVLPLLVAVDLESVAFPSKWVAGKIQAVTRRPIGMETDQANGIVVAVEASRSPYSDSASFETESSEQSRSRRRFPRQWGAS